MNRHYAEIIAAIAGWGAAFIAPLWGFLIITAVLVIADFITGIAAAIYRKERISSRGMRNTVVKIVLYFIAILLSEGMVVVFNIPAHILTYSVAFVIAVTEFRSNIENIESATGTSIWSAIKNLVNNQKSNTYDKRNKL